MSDLSYKDHCCITRACVGENGRPIFDEYDEPKVEVIYDDKCDFQPGGQTPLSIVTHNDTVYIPKAIMAQENDVISVTTQLGRKREGIIKLANDLGLDLAGDWVTEIEIKQSVEKQ